MRIVLDTNVLVSALITKGTPPDRLYNAWKKKQFELVTSVWQLQELSGVLNRPKLQHYLTDLSLPQLISELSENSDVMTDLPTVLLSPDPKDNPILATAIAGDADYLVTGDKRDLLSLIDVQGIPIITPRIALQKLD